MSINNKLIGQFGEKIALSFILKRGDVIVSKNYRCKYGEIDIISASDEYLVFTEVKTRQNSNYGYPLESVTDNKLKKIKKASQYFLLSQNPYQEYKCNLRFDAISVIISNDLSAAIISQSNKNLINIDSLINGTDYELEHVSDI